MIYFRSDYSQGAHPHILDALIRTNEEHTDGYALDPHSEHAAPDDQRYDRQTGL